MKIAIVTGPFQPLPPKGCGAVEKIWWSLATEFARRGNAVKVVSCRWDDELTQEVVDGVTIERIKRFKRSGNIGIDLLKDFFYSINVMLRLKNYEVTILNTFWLPVLCVINKSSLGKIVFNVARFPKGQMKYYRGVSLFAAVSSSVAQATKLEIPTQNIKIIPNPIDTKCFTIPDSVRDYSGKKVIAYSGRIHKEKGLEILIKAFNHLCKGFEDIELKIVGPIDIELGGGGHEYYQSLVNLSEDSPVTFVPPIFDQDGLAAFLKNAHFYCYPSIAEKGESFGVAPLEAMGTGLPVVVSDLSCFRDFVEDGTAGLVFDHRLPDADIQLAEKLRSLLLNDNLREKICDAGYKKSREYSVENIAQKYITEFANI